MAIEDTLNRLAQAIERSDASVAVREIIRQRDRALEELAGMTKDRDWWRQRANDRDTENFRRARQISAYKAHLTRLRNEIAAMKKARTA